MQLPCSILNLRCAILAISHAGRGLYNVIYCAALGNSELVRSKKTELAVFSRLFSSAVFREMAKKGRSGLFKRLAGEVGLSGLCNADATVGDAFDLAFGVLRVAGQRDEYIYRSAISHKILMGTHSLRTASMLTEFRAGTCKADLVILNGTATVYEIKSERDSLARLANQVANYKKVFAKVNVIASEDHEPVRQERIS